MSADRSQSELTFNFASGQTLSTDRLWLGFGAFGAILVPDGSGLIGKTLQFVVVSSAQPANFADTDLLTTPITLAAGANALTTDQIRECGAAGLVQLKLNTSVGSAASCVLLWKA